MGHPRDRLTRVLLMLDRDHRPVVIQILPPDVATEQKLEFPTERIPNIPNPVRSPFPSSYVTRF